MDGGFERLTSHRPSVFFFRITEDQLQFTPDMKKLFALTMLISLAMICSCQKQDSAAEQQLVQRKAELDARETALNERENALVERENALAEKEKAMANARTNPTSVQQTPDPAQVQAERDARIQQLPPEFQALIHDQSQLNSAKDEKNRLEQEQSEQIQNAREQAQRNIPRKFEAMQKWQMSGGAGSASAQASSPTPSPAEEDSSGSPSPTPQ
jgi:uncharacterized protein (DUF3084 family)